MTDILTFLLYEFCRYNVSYFSSGVVVLFSSDGFDVLLSVLPVEKSGMDCCIGTAILPIFS